MEPSSPLQPAATVVLLRDGPGGLQTLLIQRHDRSAVLGGVHVFPGGKLDAADCDPLLLARLRAPLARLHARLGEPDLDSHTAAGLFFAGCRETFEEVGVLLAEGADGSPPIAEPGGGTAFDAVLDSIGALPGWDRLVPWSRWITPDLPRHFARRFDARFFLSALPQRQQARVDGREAVSAQWLEPRAVLEAWWNRTIRLMPAQIVSLAWLARFGSAGDALANARARRPPEFRMAAATLEGLPALDVHVAAHGPAPAVPTHLVFRRGRFEPAGGLAELLAPG